MHPDDTLEAAQNASSHDESQRLRRPGRLRAALLALSGAPVVPDQIRAEWAAWQLELEAVCDKISAAAARMVTRDKRDLKKALKRLAELEDDCGCKEEAPAQAPVYAGYNPEKVALNRKALAMRGVRIPGMPIPQENGHESGAETEQS